MSKKYSHLLSPVRVGNTIIKNRMAYPNASPHFFQGPETYPAEGYRSFQARLARNGAAVISLAEWNDYPGQRTAGMDDAQRMQAFDLSDPSVENYISQLADEVHFYGSKVLVCTRPVFPEGYSLRGGMVFNINSGPAPTEPLPRERIPEVIETFIDHLRMYKRCGYDGLTMRLDLEMQPAEHERGDDYGGHTVPERMRFYIETMKRVKEVFGKGFIIEICFAGEQPKGYSGDMANGYTLEDAVAFAKAIDGYADILQIREKDIARAHPISYNFTKGDHPTIGYCEAMKKAGVKALLAPNGGFQDPEELDRYIAEGKCDMFYMARAFMCDYDYVKKIEDGRGQDIRPCLWCNKCHGIKRDVDPSEWLSVCSVNPLVGLDYKLSRMVDYKTARRRVAVIGGGVTGMQAALTAASRRHGVTLFEKTDKLGGQLFHGDHFAFKWPIAEYKNWLIRQIEKSAVKVVMNTEPTPEYIAELGFDAVIAATGAIPVLPTSIEGLRDENGNALYPTCIDIIGRESELGHKVVIVGGSETGTETAMYLADNGHDVTVLTRQCELAHDASHLHYITMSYVKAENPDGSGRLACAWEAYDNIHEILNVTTKSVKDNTVTYVDADGVEHTISADSVVICGGMSPCIDKALSYAESAARFYAAGDCNGAGNIQKCTRDAFGKAMMI